MILVLAALVALGPLATDVYVPGLPALATGLGTTASAARLTVTACLLGLALGQLVAGPLSDRVGRRRPLLAGLALYTAAGLLCAAAPDAATLVALRAVQGVGGAFAVVIAYAYVRDRHGGRQAARTFAVMLSVTGVAPVAAPLLGGLILRFGDWRDIFLALGLLSAAVLAAAALVLPESRPAGVLRAGYGRLLRDRSLIAYSGINALVFAAMFAYIAGSPFVLEDLHGLSAQQYSVVFAVNGAGIVAAAQLGRLVDARRLLTAGVLCSFGGSAALLAVTVAGGRLWPTLVALFLVVVGVGLVLPSAPALALERHAGNAGAAAALLGCAQFLAGGVAAALVGGHGSAVPMAVVMLAFSGAALTINTSRSATENKTGSFRTNSSRS